MRRPAGYATPLLLLVLLMTWAAAASGAPHEAVGRFSYNQASSTTAAASVLLPFPLPEQVVRGVGNDSEATAPLALWPRAFRLVDASRTPTGTVALALERYWDILFPHGPDAPQPQPDNPSAPEADAATTSVSRRLRLRARGSGAEFEGGDDGLVPLLGLRVLVADPREAHPQLETDEGYTLEIPAPSTALGVIATLRAQTVYGAIRGLESFSQLVAFDWAHHQERPHHPHRYLLPAGAPLRIADRPRFAWRGLMVDTSRHFLPVGQLKALLDSMAFAKLNVLHWHMSDSESFPLESRAYPNLWAGAFSPDERYLQEEVADIVEHARLRGIRVVPEFDMPGHARSWCAGYPQVCPSPQCQQPLDPSNPFTFELVNGLLQEITGGGSRPGRGLFPDAFVHLGGDEVDTRCWTETPHVVDWMAAQGNFTAEDTYKYFVDFAARAALAAQRSPVQWVEVFDEFGDKLHPETVVHVWKEKSTAQPIVAAGYRALLSDNDLWYLDHLDTPWQRFYDNEPWDGISDPFEQQLILGGEACMWGETVDASDLQSTVWPRAAAVAERLWSAAVAGTTSASATMPDGSPNDVHDRLRRFRCLLLRRGVGAAPLENGRARESPPGPGACWNQ